MMASTRRMNAMLSHTRCTASSRERDDESPNDAGNEMPVKLLSEAQVKQFVATGYLVFALDDLPAQFHEDFYRQTLELKRSGKAIGGEELATRSDAIIRSPTTRGVLTSLLGNDYAGSVWNGGVLDSSDRDQSFHKDNTHRPTREHAPRHVSLFYYPGPVSIADGPTAFVPGSQYWAVDREGLGMGEERLDPPMIPPPEGWSHEAWAAAVAQHEDGPVYMPGNNGQITYEEHDARLRSADSLLGVPGLRGHSITHPGGVCVLWHNDIIHRKSRQRPWGRDLGPAPKRVDLSVDPNHGVSFRPILRLGFHRCSEPDAAPSPGLVDDEEWTAAIGGDGPPLTGQLLGDTATHVWSSHLHWLSGRSLSTSTGERSSPAEIASLEQTFLSDATGEAHRIAAAYGLGRAGALEPLLVPLDCLSQERKFRAAIYGLTAASDLAIPPLVAALETTGSSSANRPLYRKEKIVHAIGHAAGAATITSAMSAVSKAAAKAQEEIHKIVDRLPAKENTELAEASVRGLRGYDGKVFHSVIPEHHLCNDARALLAEAAQASGLIGSRAMRLEASGELNGIESAAICQSAAQLLREVIIRGDPGAVLPSRFPLDLLERNAVEGLMQLCSSPACPPAILPAGRPTDLRDCYATVPELEQPAARAQKLGAQVSVPRGPTANPYLRLALGRLGWLAATGQLRGPRGQGAVVDEYGKDAAWKAMFDDMLPEGDKAVS